MRLRFVIKVLLLSLLAACDSSGTNNASNNPSVSNVSPPAGYEAFVENGNVPRPNNAVDVFIVYSPESQAYMPDIIRQFNTASAAGNNPVTGAAYGAGEKPVYVWGTDPVSGSSGTVARWIENAVLGSNSAETYRPTIFQPSVGHWLALVNYNTRKPIFDLAQARATAISPVVIATWKTRLDALQQTLGKQDIGWDDLLSVLDSPNGWCDYNVPDCRRAVYLGQADPNNSSTGLSTAIMQFYACARKHGFTERRLTETAVRDPQVQACVTNIQELVKHYSRRTEDFLEYVERGPDYLDFLGMEEGDVVCINLGATQGDEQCNKPAQDQLVAIYPAEGTYYHEHPFGILNADWVTAEQKTAAALFTDFVLLAESQRRILQEGFRPANPAVALEYPFAPENGVNPTGIGAVLDTPEAEAIVAIQQTWGAVKKNADVIILVDVSGSMSTENRLDQARQGIVTLIANMSARNRVALMGFSDSVLVWDELELVEVNQNSITQHALCSGTPGDCLQPLRATALYNAVYASVEAMELLSTDDKRIRLVLLLSDGQDTCEADCKSLDEVVAKIEATYNDANPVIVVPIAYGSDADIRALGSIAAASRSEVISGDPSSILDVLTALSGYY
jgi:Ca-activated chloride channel family protein